MIWKNTRLGVKTNTNQANRTNVDKALKQKSRRLKIRVIRIIRVRKPQAVRVETNTNQANLTNVDKALKLKSRRLKIRVIRIIRVRKNLKQFVFVKTQAIRGYKN